MLLKKCSMPSAKDALPGRSEPMGKVGIHAVNGCSLLPPFPAGMAEVMFGLGCFWGAEKRFWSEPGVYCTAVGYAGGYTPNPTYEEVCTGRTGHTEVVKIIYDPQIISFEQLLGIFWEFHDPTQGMRQGVDIGTQYRSAIYTYTDDQLQQAKASQQYYQDKLISVGYGKITTEISPATDFFYAENYHQQYIAKNPQRAYCASSALHSGRPSYH